MSDAPTPSRGLRPILILLGIFACGVVAGVAGTHAYGTEEMRRRIENPAERSKMRLESMRRHLDLDDKQFEAISAIMKESEAGRDSAMEPCRGDLDRHRQAVDAKVLALLSPKQQELYTESQRKRRAQWGGAASSASSSPSTSAQH
jgi:Spy/CpxP family protein refolding chaperone